MSDQWETLEDLFTQACSMEPEEQAAFLETLPASQREALDKLLRHDKEDKRSPLDSVARQARDMLAPTRESIGPYKVIERIGAGGMGAVYLAQREADFDQQVAIKIVPTLFEQPDMLDRFRNERQILADLDHPNIARLLDGGTTEDGLPYLVMEYVKGLPIDEYCRENALNLQQRLLLFESVCAAVQHAHQRLVIHRDIKPDNILVTDEGAVKLLDFGVAKLLEAGADDTRTVRAMMTPGYASPEQVRRQPLTTTTDVYSLGVLLYLLVADAPPYELAEASSATLERQICEDIPARPSAHQASLPADIDHIVMMALRKEAQRRYPTASAFAADCRRFREGYPVRAAPESLGYRAKKFVQRNAMALSLSLFTAGALLFAGYSVLASRQAAQSAELIAEQKSEATLQAAEFIGSMLAQASPLRSARPVPSVRDLLESSSRDVAEVFAGDPSLQAMLYAEIAAAMADIGQSESARRVAEQAELALAKVEPGFESRNYARLRVETLIALAERPALDGDYQGAQGMLERAATVLDQEEIPRELLSAKIKLQKARLAFEMDAEGGGLTFLEDEPSKALLEQAPILAAELLSQKGKALAAYHDELGRGLTLMKQGIDLKAGVLGDNHSGLLPELDNYASYLEWEDGRVEDIEAIARWQRAIVAENFAEGSLWEVYPFWTQGKVHELREEWQQAREQYSLFKRRVMENGYGGLPLTYIHQDIGLAAINLGDYAAAEEEFRAMLQVTEAAFGPEHWGAVDAHLYLAVALATQGDRDHLQEHLEAFFKGSPRRVHHDDYPSPFDDFLEQDELAAAMLAEHNQHFPVDAAAE